MRGVVGQTPKPMVPVAGKPFLTYLLYHLRRHGFSEVILSVGYRKQLIIDAFGSRFGSMTLHYAMEGVPLGTGGAIKNALRLVQSRDVVVLNGDTFFEIDYQQM